MTNYISYKIIDLISYLCPNHNLTMFVTEVPVNINIVNNFIVALSCTYRCRWCTNCIYIYVQSRRTDTLNNINASGGMA